MADQGAGNYVARVLGHDGQVIVQALAIEGPLRTISFAAPPKLRELLAPADPLATVPYHKLEAVYEQTADDGTRIYRLKVEL